MCSELCKTSKDSVGRMSRKETRSRLSQPVVLNPVPLVDFVLHICETSPCGTTLVVCTDQQSFLNHLVKSVTDKIENNAVGEGEGAVDLPQRTSLSHPLLERSLRLLAVSRSLKLAFCPSVAAFHAYVSTVYFRSKQDTAPSSEPASLVILNLVRMHRMTASYSVQGLGKAFATAVEAAWQTRCRLVFFEYPEAFDDNATTMTDIDHFDPSNELRDEHGENEVNASRSPSAEIENMWQEQVPILNATTKTFGNLGDRGWMGKTVKILDVATRWCTVQSLPSTSAT
jgi:hypothetical protein